MDNNNLKSNEINKVKEPNTVFESQTISENETALEVVLEQLIEIGLRQIENGEVRSHQEVMNDMKKKFKYSF